LISVLVLRCGILMAIPLIAKTIVAGMNFNDAGREEFLNGVVARLRTDVEQYVEGVPFYPH
jgi:hypothetical protein